MPRKSLGRAIDDLLSDEERELLNNDPVVPMTPREHKKSMRRLREHQSLVQQAQTAPQNARVLEVASS